MKRINFLLGGLALGAVVVLAPSTAKAGILGSSHDFGPTGLNWSSSNSIVVFKAGPDPITNSCQVCHVPHKSAPQNAANAPLWNHALSKNTYLTYDQGGSATYKGGPVTLGSSIACLTCHDGSVAVNQTYSSTGATNFNGGTAIFAPSWAIEAIGGSDLTRMHPIGVSYTYARTTGGDTDLVDPNTSALLNNTMLKGSTKSVECASCHDIHRTQGASMTATHDLIVNPNGSQLCLTCHNK